MFKNEFNESGFLIFKNNEISHKKGKSKSFFLNNINLKHKINNKLKPKISIKYKYDNKLKKYLKYILSFFILLIIFILIIIFLKKRFKKNKIKEPKIVAISYGDEKFYKQLLSNKKAAIEIGKVDECYIFGPDDIDEDFRKKNKDILKRPRGNGYWLWKPYFMLKVFKERLDYGDFLFYSDAASILVKDIRILIDFLNSKNADMWVPKQGFIEKNYCKRDTFILMEADSPYFTDTPTYNAAFQIYRKTPITEKFLEELLYYCSDKRIITDDHNTLGLPNYEGFFDHRHDQAILSILVKKYGFVTSGKPNMDINDVKKIKDESPFIFCHYRKRPFDDYDDLLRKCGVKK